MQIIRYFMKYIQSICLMAALFGCFAAKGMETKAKQDVAARISSKEQGLDGYSEPVRALFQCLGLSDEDRKKVMGSYYGDYEKFYGWSVDIRRYASSVFSKTLIWLVEKNLVDKTKMCVVTARSFFDHTLENYPYIQISTTHQETLKGCLDDSCGKEQQIVSLGDLLCIELLAPQTTVELPKVIDIKPYLSLEAQKKFAEASTCYEYACHVHVRSMAYAFYRRKNQQKQPAVTQAEQQQAQAKQEDAKATGAVPDEQQNKPKQKDIDDKHNVPLKKPSWFASLRKNRWVWYGLSGVSFVALVCGCWYKWKRVRV